MADWYDGLSGEMFKKSTACCLAWVGDDTSELGLISCAEPGVAYTDEGGTWDKVQCKQTEREINDADGNPKKVTVDEVAIYWEIAERMGAGENLQEKGKFPNGIWLGGKKYTVVREGQSDSYTHIRFADMAQKGDGKAGAGGGLTIAYNGGYLVCGVFQKPDQNNGDCHSATIEYASTLASP